MRVVHNSSRKKEKLTKEPDEDWRDIGKDKEAEGLIEQAIEAYENDLKESPLHENSWNRLMILHRKQKDYKKESLVLAKAISVFAKLYAGGKKTVHGKKVQLLSKALLKAAGLTDKKGKSIYSPEPLGRWSKRLEVVKKKL